MKFSINTLAGLAIFAGILYCSWSYRQNQYDERVFQRFVTQQSNLLATQTRGATLTTSERPLSKSINERYLSQDYQGAYALLENQLKEEPENTTLHHYAGILSMKLSLHAQAIHHFQIVRLNSDLYYAQALQNLSLLLIKLDKKEQAHAILTDLLKIGDEKEIAWAKEILKTTTN